MRILRWALLVAGSVFLWTGLVWANGGPFVVKYPGGDPAAKGILARLGPDLLPGTEERLRVLREDLSIAFGVDRRIVGDPNIPPFVDVNAVYTIENPTAERIEVDFGFPILRGIFTEHGIMGRKNPRPVVNVLHNGKPTQCEVLSNSVIYGIIRQQAREVIEKAVSNDKTLGDLVVDLRRAKDEQIEHVRQALHSYLIEGLKLNSRDSTLFEEYARLDLHNPIVRPLMVGRNNTDLIDIVPANLGPLAAIGELKATQFLAHLAGLFGHREHTGYEDLFKAWGGDVRELALDMGTGAIRPRVFSLNEADRAAVHAAGMYDPTVYARIDYLDANAEISDAQREACQAILRDLPVVFTFAPMNLLHYRVAFDAHTTCSLSVSYEQYAFADIQDPQTFQIAYVVHPASFWKDFGPIHLKINVPQGVQVRASVPLSSDQTGSSVVYQSTLMDKTGELYVAVDAGQWKTITGAATKTSASLAGKGSKVQ